MPAHPAHPKRPSRPKAKTPTAHHPGKKHVASVAHKSTAAHKKSSHVKVIQPKHKP